MKLFNKACLPIDTLRAILDRGRFAWRIGAPIRKEPITMPLDLTITNEQKVPVTVNPVTAGGKPAQLDGAPVWSVATGDGTVELTPDPLTVFLVSGDLPGDTTFVVQADADLGAGIVTVSDAVTLHVSGALAESLGLTAGTPVVK